MQTSLPAALLQTRDGQEADRILRACVHCGFCTATCPTYQLLGDELDGPRGRIYLIKQMLEGASVSRLTQRHLDRCLTCRSCETTCPSGVEYGRLLEIGRDRVERQVPRPPAEWAVRWALRRVLPYPRRFGPLLRLGQALRPLLPGSLRAKVPPRRQPGPRPAARHSRCMLLLEGCAQSAATPDTNAAAARVLDRLGIGLVSPPGQGCCGAVSAHLGAPEEGRDFMRRNIDAWWPEIENGAEAILIGASGCAVMVKEYGHALADDPQYAERARRVSELARDLSQVLAAEPLEGLPVKPPATPVAFHSPCTLQHGQQLAGVVERILTRLGFQLTEVADAHLCCGSAGTYSLLQPALATRLRDNKLERLQAGAPTQIATANVGCQLHLEGGAKVPVRHWIELVDEALAAAEGSGAE